MTRSALSLLLVGCVTDDLTGSRCDDAGVCGSGYVCKRGLCVQGSSAGGAGGAGGMSPGAGGPGGGAGGVGGAGAAGGLGGAGGGVAGGGAGGAGGSSGGSGGGITGGLNVGDTCTVGLQCLSGSCAAGKCACGGALNCPRCERPCDATGTQCVPVDAGEVDPSHTCVEDLSGCVTGRCAADGSCLRFDAGTVCAPRRCADDACVGQCLLGGVRSASLCGASGGCPDGGLQTCANDLVCDPQTLGCRTACRFTADCRSGFYCSAGGCVPKLQIGEPCASREVCGSHVCASGTCQECEDSSDCSPDAPDCESFACMACLPLTPPSCSGFGNMCPEDAGICTASFGEACFDERANVFFDPFCGCEAAGVACPLGRQCIDGGCQTRPGEVCFAPAECASLRCDGGHCE
jgi:hypothetical protein